MTPRTNGRPRFSVLDANALEALPRPAYLVHDVVVQQTLAVLYAAAGTGKSFVALDLGLAVATGTSWHGHAVVPGAVVYVAAEGGAGLGERLRAWKLMHQIDVIADGWFVLEALNLLDQADVDEFLAALAAVPVTPVLLIFDTLARCLLGGDENSAKDMGIAVAACDRIGRALNCTVLVVHHTGKSGEIERGSTALRGAADTMLTLAKDGDLVTIVCTKQKNAPEFLPVGLRLVPVDHNDSCVLKDAPARASELAGNKLIALQTLAYFARDGASYTRWLGATKLEERTFLRARKELIDDKYVQKEGEGRRQPYLVTPEGLAALESKVTGNYLHDTGRQASGTGHPSPAPPAHPFRGAGAQAGDGDGTGMPPDCAASGSEENAPQGDGSQGGEPNERTNPGTDPPQTNLLRVLRHVHVCPSCSREFRCTTPECFGRPTECTCCKLDRIEGRRRR
jgi:hypothetical protein